MKTSALKCVVSKYFGSFLAFLGFQPSLCCCFLPPSGVEMSHSHYWGWHGGGAAFSFISWLCHGQSRVSFKVTCPVLRCLHTKLTFAITVVTVVICQLRPNNASQAWADSFKEAFCCGYQVSLGHRSCRADLSHIRPFGWLWLAHVSLIILQNKRIFLFYPMHGLKLHWFYFVVVFYSRTTIWDESRDETCGEIQKPDWWKGTNIGSDGFFYQASRVQGSSNQDQLHG